MKFFHQKIIFSIVAALFLLSCSGEKKQQEKTAQKPPLPEILNDDGTLLFNGENLNNWKITEFGTQGPVYVSEGKMVLNYGDGCTGVTWDKDFPKVNYKVTLEARKTSGNDFFCGMTFPVNEEFCSLIVGGWGGPVVGLSCIDGNDAANNETRILKQFEKDTWYRITLEVTQEYITANIDGEQLVHFNYPNHELYVRPEVNLSRPFGICSWVTTAELRNIRLKLL
ncbi:MAG: DUF1080 domain-containing protein [Draconibacterium sp.]